MPRQPSFGEVRKREAGVGGGDTEVACERQLGALGERVAADRGDDRHR
jgi:hypothetical protein